jgi:hypothetical protein
MESIEDRKRSLQKEMMEQQPAFEKKALRIYRKDKKEASKLLLNYTKQWLDENRSLMDAVLEQ